MSSLPPEPTTDVLAFASIQDRKRLLELFPIAKLRTQWPDQSGTKSELCFWIASNADSEEIVDFIGENFGCCKQHIVVFSREGGNEAPEIDFPGGHVLWADEHGGVNRVLYGVEFDYEVVLREPLEEAHLRFVWPIRLDHTGSNVILRFVILEKNISTYFEGRSYYVSGKSIEEKNIIEAVGNAIEGLEPTDLHKGVKKLWEDGVIDSPRAKFKKTLSTASEAMDEDRLIKEHNPELYEIVIESPLFNTLFYVIPDRGLEVSAFSVDPSKGLIGFPRYSDDIGDTDQLVAAILDHNQ